MRIQRTYYEVLGLERTASPQDVKSKYHELARQFHPDRAQDKVLAERLFVQINLAYRTLMDREKRAIYDAGLFQMDAVRPVAAGPSAAGAKPGAPQPGAPPATPPPQLDVIEAMSQATAAYMGGDRITAHKTCMAVLKFDPINIEAHSLVGDIYADQGRRQEALDEYKAAASVRTPSFTLQQKISRMESLISQSRSAPPKPTPPTAPPRTPPPQPKKGTLIDRLIGRGR